MSDYFVLSHDTARQRAQEAIKSAPQGYIVKITEPTRTLDQNALLWPLLDCVSKQVDWYGNKLTKEEWKDVFTASLKKQKVVAGLEGGFVMCGSSTSKMGKRMFSDLCELIFAFGASRNPPVNFGDKA
jgi:hypothetical protein